MSVGVRMAIFCCRSSSQIWNTEKVDNSSCREVRWHQGFAELIIVKKTGALSMIDPGTQSPMTDFGQCLLACVRLLRRSVGAGSGDAVVALAGDRDARVANRSCVDVSARDEDREGLGIRD